MASRLGVSVPIFVVFFVAVLLMAVPIVVQWRLWHRVCRTETWPTGDWPRVALILPIRGVDPFFLQTLQCLRAIDYPNWRLLIVYDAVPDDCLQGITTALAGLAVDMAPLATLPRTCSLKAQAIVEACGRLQNDDDVVAFMDSDVRPHPQWLRQLVVPFAIPEVGATSGVRWFAPGTSGWGTLIRSLWNSLASAWLSLGSMTWGGTMAVRRSLIAKAELVEMWQSAFNDDLAVGARVIREGSRVVVVHRLVVVNHEDAPYLQIQRWITRQMLHFRTGSPWWRAYSLTAAVVALTVLSITIWVISLAWRGDWWATQVWCALLMVYAWLMATPILGVHREFSRVAAQRGETMPTFGWRLLPALLAAHVVGVYGILAAALIRVVRWRGVAYRFQPTGGVIVEEILPLAAATATRTVE